MSKAPTAQKEQLKAAPLDPSVRALGVVSLLNDFSSEVAVRTLPLFLANVLGVRIGVIGLIEGIAERTKITKSRAEALVSSGRRRLPPPIAAWRIPS